MRMLPRLWSRRFTSPAHEVRPDLLRNLIIIAHIDSGKSTLSDRLLQVTGTVPAHELEERAQFLDSNPIERERQITIKARAARMKWRQNLITLIDCPGHHDFSRQVSRSAGAVEGALLVVDATKGVQAQTLSSVELALDAGLELVPVINKIDLATADVTRARAQLEDQIGLDGSSAVLTSAKNGVGIEALLDAVVQQLPAPGGATTAPLQALVFDSYYDTFRGVVLLVRVVNGVVRRGDPICTMSGVAARHGASRFVVDSVGFLAPHEVECGALHAGEIGFLTAAIRRTGDVPVGDTLTHVGERAADAALPGYEDARPVVFCGMFPADGGDFNALRQAFEKLYLQDGSISFEPHSSSAMGSGFRCGFLGLLHMSVTQERLEKEFGLELLTSAPSVSYMIQAEDSDEWRLVSNPASIPPGRVKFQEPFARVEMICKQEHVGQLMTLAQSKRGKLLDQKPVAQDRVKLIYSLPLAELITDLHDGVKSRTAGFASLSYELDGMQPSRLARMDIHVAGDAVDGLKKQAEGKKRMRQVGKLRVPQEAFAAVVARGV